MKSGKRSGAAGAKRDGPSQSKVRIGPSSGSARPSPERPISLRLTSQVECSSAGAVSTTPARISHRLGTRSHSTTWSSNLSSANPGAPPHRCPRNRAAPSRCLPRQIDPLSFAKVGARRSDGSIGLGWARTLGPGSANDSWGWVLPFCRSSATNCKTRF